METLLTLPHTDTFVTLSPEQYLQTERQALREQTGKHELLNGELIAMSGASEQHNTLAANVLALLWWYAKGKNFKIYGSDMRIFNPLNNSFCYPDVCVVSGTPQMTDANHDLLLNPLLLIEILSPTTERYDRSDKLTIYRSIPTVQEYVLVSQDKVYIESYYRQANGKWLYTEVNHLQEPFTFQSLPHTLAVADIYEGVTFATQNPVA